jgi:hypothetical protein
LLFHAKDDAFDVVEDTEAKRRKGWQRISLFAFYFQPRRMDVVKWGSRFAMPSKRRIGQGRRISVGFRSTGTMTGSSPFDACEEAVACL